MCALSVDSCRKELEEKFTTASSEKSKFRWRSKVNLLNELMILCNMPLHLAYDEYMVKIPLEIQAKYKDKTSAVHTFVESILHANGGLPVAIINTPDKGFRMVVLYENIGTLENIRNLTSLNSVLAQAFERIKSKESIVDLTIHFK